MPDMPAGRDMILLANADGNEGRAAVAMMIR
jgi:hypothetical protein